MVRGSASTAGATNAEFLSGLAYWGILSFGIIAALNQLQIAPMVVNTLFIGLVATLVLALGLSFGLGGREVAAQMTREWSDRARSMGRPENGGSYRDQLTRPHPQEYEDIVPPLGSNAPGTRPTTRRAPSNEAMSSTPPHADPLRREI
jgi:hypothetical protein